jgi:hypothetical protein
MPRNRVNPILAELELECQRWNEAHPVGTRVFVQKDNGIKQLTRTRSEASVLSGHSAVIYLEGISGCYLLSRVTVAKPEEML